MTKLDLRQLKNMKINKKGDEILTEHVIFIVLNLIFFAVMLLFILRSSNSAGVYEQAYAKQIAMLIDRAEPDMTFSIDISKLIEIAKKKGQITANIVGIDNTNNKVTVSLSKTKGYSFQYYTNYDVSILNPESIENSQKINIAVKEKNG
jgi:hypothetical protein